MNSENDKIRNVIDQYYEGLFTCDIDLLKQVFHPEAHYATGSTAKLLHLDMESYFKVISERISPQSKGEHRYLEVDFIEFAGPVTATVRLRCHMLGNAYTDILTFLKLDDRWQIISKAFHVEPQ